jgi:hypothetical protein
MVPAKYNIDIKTGNTFEMTITVSDFSLTGYTAAMQIRETREIGSPLVLDCTNYLVVDALGGTITLTIPAAATEAINTSRSAVYDLEIVSGTTKHRILEGVVVFTVGVIQ